MININIQDDRLFQDFVYNYAELIDFLYEHSASMVLECYCENKNIDDYIKELLDFKLNLMLKESFIGIKDIYEHANIFILYLEFSMTDGCRSWLLKHRDILAFNRYNFESIFPYERTSKRMDLINPSFYDAKNRKIMYFNDGVGNTDIHEDYIDIFEKWSNTVVFKKVDAVRAFAREFNCAVKNEDKNIVEHFSSDVYSYNLFFDVIDKSDDYFEYLGLSDFYTDKNNVRLFIKILINKLKKKFDFDMALRLFEFFDSEYDINDIEKYFLDLDKSILIKLFNETLFLQTNCKALNNHGIVFINRMINLWNKMCVDDSQGIPEFIRFKEAWEDSYECNYKGHYFSEKKLELIKLLKIALWKCDKKIKRDYIQGITDSEREKSFYKMLAWDYLYGIVCEKNYYKAFEKFLCISKIFAESIFITESAYDLARCYLNGWGTEKDIEQAKYWFTVAAENGHPKAREQLDRL